MKIMKKHTGKIENIIIICKYKCIDRLQNINININTYIKITVLPLYLIKISIYLSQFLNLIF